MRREPFTIPQSDRNLRPRVAVPERAGFKRPDHDAEIRAGERDFILRERRRVCHQIVLERHAAPYKIILGADSHTCTHGALGAFATGMGSTDMAAIMAYGKTWLKVPTSYRIEVTGNLGAHVYSEDAVLHLCGRITADGTTYMSMEFLGSAVDAMSVESRAVMSNMAIEAGGKCGLCAADDKTREFLCALRKI